MIVIGGYMKRTVAILILVCVSAIAIAGPIEDAVEQKVIETLMVLASINGYIANELGAYQLGGRTLQDLIDMLNELVEVLRGGAVSIAQFTQNIEVQR